MPVLESVATTVPEHRVRQDELKDVARPFLEERAPELLDLLPVFDKTGIEARSFAKPIPWYLDAPGWGDRADAFETVGTDLAAKATETALASADLPPSSVDGVVFVSTTGLATPSLDTHLVNRVGLPQEAKRVPVWGLGCAGGAAGLARAADLARADPEGRYLLISLELCSLAFLTNDLSKRNIVAAALFGDGCAAALVAGDELDAEGPELVDEASHLWPGTEDVMGWDVRDEGLGVVFSKRIPEIVETRLPGVVQRLLKRSEVALDDVRALFHPGGPKVIEAYEDGLGLDPAAFETTRAVLRDQGNMSSPTALFVLERALSEDPLEPGEPGVVAAVGPGFAAELCLLRGAA